MECKTYRPHIRQLWKCVGEALGWKRRKSRRISYLFHREEVEDDVLEFLRTTRVGMTPEVERDESDMESEADSG